MIRKAIGPCQQWPVVRDVVPSKFSHECVMLKGFDTAGEWVEMPDMQDFKIAMDFAIILPAAPAFIFLDC